MIVTPLTSIKLVGMLVIMRDRESSRRRRKQLTRLIADVGVLSEAIREVEKDKQ
jgi:hypothetical protein